MPNENPNFENKDLKSLKYNILDTIKDILLDNSCDSDWNCLNIEIKNFNIPYVIPEKFHSQFEDHISDGLSFLHINIRSINKNFENQTISFFLGFYIECNKFFWDMVWWNNKL